MNDADIEMAHLNAAADHESRLARKGICAHGHCQTDQRTGECRCLYCGRVFADFEALADERDEILG